MRKIIGLIIYLTSLSASAQTEGTQYFMKSLPQVSINNPAFIPNYDFSIGLPGISSVAATYTNNGFSYRDVSYKSDGTTKADLDGFQNSLTSKNYVTTTAQTDLLRMGFRTSKKLYFQLSSTARQYTRAMLPKELTSLLVLGTTSPAGTLTHFSPQVDGTAWIETALGAAYKVNNKLTIGLRIKYLKGIGNATTLTSDLSIATADNNVITAAADVRVRTSGVYDAREDGYSFKSQFKNYMTNIGGAIDIGGTYQLTDKITLAASLVDFGKIRWRNNRYDYVLNKDRANYTFTGIDPDKLVQWNKEYVEAQGDSIDHRFAFQQEKAPSYTTWLPGRMLISGSYFVTRTFSTGLLMVAENYQNRFSQSLTASASKNFGKVLSTTVSYTISNRSANNFGAGFSLNLRPFQFYLVGDNLLNASASLLSSSHNLDNYLNHTQVFNLRAGMNIIWGLNTRKDERKIYPSKKEKGNKVLRMRKKGNY